MGAVMQRSDSRGSVGRAGNQIIKPSSY